MSAVYRLRNATVEAMQLTNPVSSAELAAFCGLGTMTGMMGELTVTVPTPFGPVLVQTGGWIAKEWDGSLFGYSDAAFHARYLRHDAPDAVPGPIASFLDHNLPEGTTPVPLAP